MEPVRSDNKRPRLADAAADKAANKAADDGKTATGLVSASGPMITGSGGLYMIDRSKLQVQRLSQNAKLPVRGTAGAAGYDLASAIKTIVPKRGKQLVPTDLAVRVPAGTYGRIAPRSGLAWKNSIDVGAGVVDEDYTGNVGVILFNHSDVDFPINIGDRVAQLILERIAIADVDEILKIDETARGSGGFGSTGVATAAAATAASSSSSSKS
jgi:dUTP pyrophosphatase